MTRPVVHIVSFIHTVKKWMSLAVLILMAIIVAVIAVARKVILLDLEKYPPLALIGLATIIIALGGCYWLLKLSYRPKNSG